jgi:hypothetical protein
MTTTYQVPGHVKSVIDGDGAVVLDIRQGKYFSLNGIGADIWRYLEAGEALTEIELRLARTYDAPEETLRRDLAEFVEQLKTGQLVYARD